MARSIVQGVGQQVSSSDLSQIHFTHAFESTNQAFDKFLTASVGAMAAVQNTAVSGTTYPGIYLNSGLLTTSSASIVIRTHKAFPMYQSCPTLFEFDAAWAGTNGTNSVSEFGAGYASGISAPTEGAFFRITAATGTTPAKLQCVTSNGTTETVADYGGFANSTTNLPALGEFHHYRIETFNEFVVFQVDELMPTTIKTPLAQPTSTTTASAPIFFRVYNTGTASAARALIIGYCAASSKGKITSIPETHAICAKGGLLANVQPGTASGSNIANYAYNAVTSIATLSSSSGQYAGLGGVWDLPVNNAQLSTNNTDYNVFQFQNPVLGTGTAKTLYITGVRVGEAFCTGTLAWPSTLAITWGIATGSTTNALSQASDGTTVTMPRKFALGTQIIKANATAATGDYAPGFQVDFCDAPAIVHPGQYCNIFFRFSNGSVGGAATNSARGTITVFGYFE